MEAEVRPLKMTEKLTDLVTWAGRNTVSIDARFFSDTQFNSKIDALMEILAQPRRS